jgi:hypothetical protein
MHRRLKTWKKAKNPNQANGYFIATTQAIHRLMVVLRPFIGVVIVDILPMTKRIIAQSAARR